MLPELIQKQHGFREQTGNDKVCFDCADANGSRVEPSSKAYNKIETTLDGPVFVSDGCWIIYVPFWTSIGSFKRNLEFIVTHFERPEWPSWPSFAGLEK